MTEQVTDKRMRLRYAGRCRLCDEELAAGVRAVYERPTKTVRCLACPQAPVEAPPEAPTEVPAAVYVEVPVEPAPVAAVPDDRIESGRAGSSARREYERRRAKDEAAIRERWGRFGGIAVRLSAEKQTTAAWARGAVGEERLGAALDAIAGDSIAVLHDRRIPGSRANIDHLAITPAGIWVIDAKRYADKRPTLRIEGGWVRPRTEKLMVGGRDRTKLVDGVLTQMSLVEKIAPEVPVTGALCFIDADFPLFGGAFTTRGVHVLWRKRLVKLLAEQTGTLDVPALGAQVARAFPPA